MARPDNILSFIALLQTNTVRKLSFPENHPLNDLLKFEDVTLEILKLLQNFDLSLIPDDILLKLESLLPKFQRIVKHISENRHGLFISEDGTYTEYKEAYFDLYHIALNVLPLITSNIAQSQKANNYISQIQQTLKSVTETSNSLSNTRDTLGKQLDEAEEILKQINNKHREMSVAEFSAIFETQSNNFLKQSNIWLTVLGTLILTIIILAYNFLDPNKTPDQSEIVIYIARRIVVFSILFFSISFTLRNYKASKHNEIINKQKQNALDSFIAFANNPISDNVTKSAILMKTTDMIYSHQSTGYNNKDGENDNPNKIIEIVKNITDHKSNS